MEERSLGENRPDTEQPGEVRDITLDEWIEGVRAFRLPVDVTLVTGDPTGEKAQRLLDLADQIDALPDGPEVDNLIEEAEAIQSSITTTMRFVLEQRSRERVAATRAAAFQSLGIAEGADLSEAQASAIGLRMVLDQIVSPESVTLAQLEAIHAKASDAADLLAVAMAKVNGGASNARVVVRDFSKRSSRTRSTRQS